MKWLGGAVAVAIAFLAVVGFAHTPSGRFLLPYLWLGQKCPVGGDMAPADRDAVRAQVLAPDASATPALARPALGFKLGVTTAADVDTWLTAHNLTCPHDIGTLRCEDVPAGALASGTDAFHAAHEAAEIRFGFDAGTHLISVDAHYDFPDAESAIAVYQSASDALTTTAGAVTEERGLGTAEHLDRGALQQEKRTWWFSDYRAGLTLTNQGHGRYVLRETFQDVPKGGKPPTLPGTLNAADVVLKPGGAAPPTAAAAPAATSGSLTESH